MNLLGLIISTDFVYMWIRVATPIIFASLGAVICTKAGVVNLGLEGIMLISALAGVLGSAFGGNLVWGVLAGLLAAVAVSAVFAYFHLVLKANNVLCGTAVNTMATGLTVFVLDVYKRQVIGQFPCICSVFYKGAGPVEHFQEISQSCECK